MFACERRQTKKVQKQVCLILGVSIKVRHRECVLVSDDDDVLDQKYMSGYVKHLIELA